MAVERPTTWFHDGLLRAAYDAASVDPQDVLSDLQPHAPLATVEATASLPPEHIDTLVDRYIRSARLRGSMLGAGLGLVGWVGVPPTLVHTFVEILRLAQRISLAYGVDWRTDRGEIELWRALAVAVDAKVEWEGLEVDPLDRLPAVVIGPGTVRNPLLLRAAQAIVLQVARMAGTRATRWVPVVGSGTGLVLGFLQVDRVGKRLKRRFQARHQVSRLDISQAVEVEILKC